MNRHLRLYRGSVLLLFFHIAAQSSYFPEFLRRWNEIVCLKGFSTPVPCEEQFGAQITPEVLIKGENLTTIHDEGVHSRGSRAMSFFAQAYLQKLRLPLTTPGWHR